MIVCVFLSIRQWCVWRSSEHAVGERQEEVSRGQSSCRVPEGEEPVLLSVSQMTFQTGDRLLASLL